MLFLSRRLDVDQFGVVDTEDGVEEVVISQTLREALDLGIKIDGVSMSNSFGSFRPALDIEPVQDQSMITALQTKMKVVGGVDMVIYKDEIVSLRWGEDHYRDDTRVRLSQFGKRCGYRFLSYQIHPYKRIVLVLDDDIEIDSRALDRYDTDVYAVDVWVTFDLTEVTNQQTLDLIYGMYRESSLPFQLSQLIIDNPERLDYMRALGVLDTGKDPIVREFLPGTLSRLGDMMLPVFEAIAEKPFDMVWLETTKQYREGIKRDAAFWRSNCQSYEKVHKHDIGMFSHMRGREPSEELVKRAANYLSYFEPLPKIQKLYVRICNTLNQRVLEY